MAFSPHLHFPPHPRLHLLLLPSSKSLHSHRPLPTPTPTPTPNPTSASASASASASTSTSTSSWLTGWSQLHPHPHCSKPRLHRPSAAVDYRSDLSDDEDAVGTSRSTGSSTMGRIIQKLKKYGYIDEDASTLPTTTALPRGSVEDIFYAEDGVLPNARGGLDLEPAHDEDARFPWEKPPPAPHVEDRRRARASMAELTLPASELRRLRHMAIRVKSRTKIGGAGLTKEVVDKIHEKWKTEEVVRIKVEGAPALNMRRMHEILEKKTGGLVIWRSGTSVSLYRGVAYDTPEPFKGTNQNSQAIGMKSLSKGAHTSSLVPTEKVHSIQDTHEGLGPSVDKEQRVEPVPEIKYEDEIDKLLDELGPRYSDWPGCDPLPVDADLLPGTLPGYKPPFRILPYGVKATLSRKDATNLRRLARALPPHFALGRSRQHQGLATAMVKLWEKSSIAKVALKRGVQLTTSERMAEDIKKLTGGIMLSRNKDFIVFYRGNDFLSSELTEALLERERLAKALQDEEEQARGRAAASFASSIETAGEPAGTASTTGDAGAAGTLGETLEADSKYGNKLDDDHALKMMRTVEAARHADLVRKLELKLSLAEKKIMKAEKALAKVEASLKPTELMKEPETITDEERFMFRKLGLRMKAFLLLGRRGVFDGTIENMHLHWKYRELVKILVKAKSFNHVKKIALSLEAESGGVLVSVDKVSKGYAIVVFRGKEYQRPSTLRPKNLLSKRKALARSIECQRQEAISCHITNLKKKVEQLRSELLQMEGAKDRGDEDLYVKLDSAYSSDEEDVEEEDDDAYLRSFDNPVDADKTEDGGAERYLDDEGDCAQEDGGIIDKDDGDNDFAEEAESYLYGEDGDYADEDGGDVNDNDDENDFDDHDYASSRTYGGILEANTANDGGADSYHDNSGEGNGSRDGNVSHGKDFDCSRDENGRYAGNDGDKRIGYEHEFTNSCSDNQLN